MTNLVEFTLKREATDIDYLEIRKAFNCEVIIDMTTENIQIVATFPDHDLMSLYKLYEKWSRSDSLVKCSVNKKPFSTEDISLIDYPFGWRLYTFTTRYDAWVSTGNLLARMVKEAKCDYIITHSDDKRIWSVYLRDIGQKKSIASIGYGILTDVRSLCGVYGQANRLPFLSNVSVGKNVTDSYFPIPVLNKPEDHYKTMHVHLIDPYIRDVYETVGLIQKYVGDLWMVTSRGMSLDFVVKYHKTLDKELRKKNVDLNDTWEGSVVLSKNDLPEGVSNDNILYKIPDILERFPKKVNGVEDPLAIPYLGSTVVGGLVATKDEINAIRDCLQMHSPSISFIVRSEFFNPNRKMIIFTKYAELSSEQVTTIVSEIEYHTRKFGLTVNRVTPEQYDWTDISINTKEVK